MDKRDSGKAFSKKLKNTLFVIAGTIILAFGTAVFILPFNLINGGVSGIAVITEYLSRGSIKPDITIAVVGWGFLLFGMLALGVEFAAKTLLSSLIYPISVAIILRVFTPAFANGYFTLPQSDSALIPASFIGGALVGLGCALAFIGGGSTGGIDIPALIICKLFPSLRRSAVIFAFDASIVITGAIVIKNLYLTLMGIISAAITAIVIEKVLKYHRGVEKRD